MAFDITSVLKDVSRPDTGKESIKYISLDLIDPDPNNFYSLEGLDELAGNIELIGLPMTYTVGVIQVVIADGRDERHRRTTLVVVDITILQKALHTIGIEIDQVRLTACG